MYISSTTLNLMRWASGSQLMRKLSSDRQTDIRATKIILALYKYIGHAALRVVNYVVACEIDYSAN